MSGLIWGYKLVGTDMCTDDHRGGRFRYRLGEWHESAGPHTSSDCPTQPGDGLCVARTLAGAQSGGARLGSSVMLLVGYLPDDVLCDSGSKIKVKRLFVHPDPLDPIRIITGPGAYLTGADLRGANLSGAYLTRADLTGAYLTRADLTGAYLTGADLTRANLTGADLSGAYLSGADLTGAYLSGADLTGADLTGAYLTRANLTRANRPSWLPKEWTVTANGFITEAES